MMVSGFSVSVSQARTRRLSSPLHPEIVLGAPSSPLLRGDWKLEARVEFDSLLLRRFTARSLAAASSCEDADLELVSASSVIREKTHVTWTEPTPAWLAVVRLDREPFIRSIRPLAALTARVGDERRNQLESPRADVPSSGFTSGLHRRLCHAGH